MMVGERGLRFSARSALRAVADATLSRFARLKPPSEVLILFCYERKKPAFCKAGFSNMVGERGLRFSARSALRAVADATLSRCARLKPPSEVLILFCYERKKPAFCKAGFSNMVGERGFEPPTHWSQTSCATKLRYSPIFYCLLLLTCFAWCEERDLNPHVRKNTNT